MNFIRLTSEQDIRDLIHFHNKNSTSVVIDTETTSVNPREAKLLDIQISGRGKDDAVIFSGDYCQLLLEFAPHIFLVAHNYKYDAHVLFIHGVDLLDRNWRDTLLLGHLVDENRESYSLDSYVKEYCEDDYKEKFWEKYKSYEEAPESDKVTYACSDILYTRRLFESLLGEISSQDLPHELINTVHGLQKALLRTEIFGIKIDLEYLGNLGVKIRHRLDELGPEMRELVKDEIEILELESWAKALDSKKSDRGKAAVKRPTYSFESSKQLQELLYGELRLPPQRNEKTKALSTDFASLEKIKDLHPVIGLIQENRELQKVYTAYIEGTLKRYEYDRESTPRIYPNFRVNGTTTGRISHSNPNLAQLPKSGGVRAIYVPDQGRRFISADYSQLEVIIEANLTSDRNLVRMLENGESKHDVTARELGCSRDTAKTLNFAMQYWCGPGKVAKLLGVPDAEGRRVYNRYWQVYSGSKRLKEQTDKMVEDGTPIVNLFGRKRRFKSGKRTTWDKDLRQAYNFLIQGTGADITSKAFYLVSEHLQDTGMGRGLWSIHDEILIEVESQFSDVADPLLQDFMVGVGNDLGLKIPLRVESSGPTTCWQD